MIALSVALLAALLATPAIAQSPGSPDFALLFDLAAPFPFVQSYGGGIGCKVVFPRDALRLLVAASYNGATGSLALEAGAAYELHPVDGPISPYLGVALDGGYVASLTTATVLPFSIAALVGAELYLLDYLSLFAEYAFALDFAVTIGSDAPPVLSYVVGSRMGNNATIGLALYLNRGRRSR